MKRNDIVATAMHLTGSKIQSLARKINAGNMDILSEINMPSYIHTMHYIEDITEEVRDVTCIDFGCPVQLTVHFCR